MSAKTRIIVIRRRQLLIAGIILLAVVGLLAILLTFGNRNNSDLPSTEAESAAVYVPGVYTSTVMLSDTALDVQVVVDENHINSISMINLDETVETMYPLIRPAIEELSDQIISTQSLANITYSISSQYTSMVLYEAICDALNKAAL